MEHHQQLRLQVEHLQQLQLLVGHLQLLTRQHLQQPQLLVEHPQLPTRQLQAQAEHPQRQRVAPSQVDRLISVWILKRRNYWSRLSQAKSRRD